jgi:hypothetical protein
MTQFFRNRAAWGGAVAFALPGTGCGGTRSVVSGVGSVLTTTVKTTGRLAGETVKAGGQLAGTGIKAAAHVVSPSVVTVVQETGLTVRRLPLKEGMTLYAASRRMELEAGVKALEVLRGEEIISRSGAQAQRGENDVVLRRGDVIRLVK